MCVRVCSRVCSRMCVRARPFVLNSDVSCSLAGAVRFNFPDVLYEAHVPSRLVANSDTVCSPQRCTINVKVCEGFRRSSNRRKVFNLTSFGH